MMSSDLLKCLISLKLFCVIVADSSEESFDFQSHWQYFENVEYPVLYLPEYEINIPNSTHKVDFPNEISDKTIKCFLFVNEKKKHRIDSSYIPVYFDPEKETKIITHGWVTSIRHKSVTQIQNAYLKKNKYNVVSCDWSPISKNVVYLLSAQATEAVGIHLGNLIKNIMHETGTSPSKIHFIGHSLGAHVASAVGKVLRGSLGRITCLDPAGPCFESLDTCTLTSPLTIISPHDARFVDVIHTCRGILGLSEPVGHADFYPNGGGPVIPGCEIFRKPMNEFSCSHARSFEYFAESIDSSHFVASKCESWTHFILKKCENGSYIMGDSAEHDYRGSFYLFTDGQKPFGLGKVD